MLSHALVESSERNFLTWSDDRALRFASEDELHNGLLAAAVNAHLTGEHGTWRATLSLLAQHDLMSGDYRNPVPCRDALDQLRRSGDTSSLEKAGRRVWRVGSLAGLADAAALVTESSWTHATAEANLKMWEVGGDLLAAEPASAAARYCLAIAFGVAPREVAQARPSFFADFAALKALRGLLPAADDDVSRSCALSIAALPDKVHDLTASELPSVISRIQLAALQDEDRNALLEFALHTPMTKVAAVALGVLQSTNSDAAMRCLTVPEAATSTR